MFFSTEIPTWSSKRPAKGDQYFTGKLRGNWRGSIGTTWEARIKLDCLYPGLWPSFWTVNEDPQPDGEVDLFEWYGNGEWAPGTTVHAASNGKTWEGKSIAGMVDSAWHTWRMRWDEEGFKFWRDYVDGAKPYFSVPPKPIHVFGAPPEDKRWPFSNPGYWMTPMLTLAVGGVGAGDPAAARSRLRCSSITCESGSDLPHGFDHLYQAELPPLDQSESQLARNREGRGCAVGRAGRNSGSLLVRKHRLVRLRDDPQPARPRGFATTSGMRLVSKTAPRSAARCHSVRSTSFR